MYETAIEVSNLAKTLGKRQVLAGISFQVPRGTVFGYLGPNGAGKTTTVRILLDLLRPTSGIVRIMGQDPAQMSRDEKAKIGAVLDDHGLYEHLTAWQNLDFYGHIYRLPNGVHQERIAEWLHRVELWPARNAKVGTYSKGMKQRLALARALLHNPQTIFLDEPTAGLDPEGTAAIRQLILQMASEEQRTIFLNSHDLDEVERTCSIVAILKQGTLVAHGAVTDLRRQFSKVTVEIRLAQAAAHQDIGALLQSLPYVTSHQAMNGSGVVKAELNDLKFQADLMRALVEHNVRVDELRQVGQSLEDVYLSIVQEAEKDAH